MGPSGGRWPKPARPWCGSGLRWKRRWRASSSCTLIHPAERQAIRLPRLVVIRIELQSHGKTLRGALRLAQMDVDPPQIEMRELAIFVPGSSEGLLQPGDGLTPPAQLDEVRSD